ncbi:hypothetical protein PIB30_043864 [Stylosanthes scabra]|uniref:CCHC-type domain-containing protein n=1 Tax=Stylosanthes scabra TaxID=79078 RepID=A0ABU6QF21_9FABA|nr:hypothetical protein [Stylosanthes scabra]
MHLGSGPENTQPSHRNVKDPVVVRTKGAPRVPKGQRGRKRRCTKCHKPGHTKRHCRGEDDPVLEASSLHGSEEAYIPSQGSSPSYVGAPSIAPSWRGTCSRGFGNANVVTPESDTRRERGPEAKSDSSDEDDFLEGVMANINALTDSIMAGLAKC